MSAEDREHLRLLSIFHYVVAGVAALVSFFPIFHLVIGIAVVTGGFAGTGESTQDRFFGWIFIGFALLFILTGLAFAATVVYAGNCLRRERHYYFCLVMAALLCGFMPFGTVLGVFTLIVLLRPGVRDLFGVRLLDEGEPPAGAAAGYEHQGGARSRPGDTVGRPE